MRISLAFALVAFCGIAVAGEKVNTRYGSVALSPSSGAYGFTQNYEDKKRSQIDAFLTCQAQSYPKNDCVVFMTGAADGYYVLAMGDGKKAVVVGGLPTEDAATKLAIDKCNALTTNCQSKHWWTNGEIKQ
jgi:hypothetical protein